MLSWMKGFGAVFGGVVGNGSLVRDRVGGELGMGFRDLELELAEGKVSMWEVVWGPVLGLVLRTFRRGRVGVAF